MCITKVLYLYYGARDVLDLHYGCTGSVLRSKIDMAAHTLSLSLAEGTHGFFRGNLAHDYEKQREMSETEGHSLLSLS